MNINVFKKPTVQFCLFAAIYAGDHFFLDSETESDLIVKTSATQTKILAAAGMFGAVCSYFYDYFKKKAIHPVLTAAKSNTATITNSSVSRGPATPSKSSSNRNRNLSILQSIQDNERTGSFRPQKGSSIQYKHDDRIHFSTSTQEKIERQQETIRKKVASGSFY